VIVRVEERHAPAEILGVQAESRGKSLVVKRSVTVVVVERGGIVGKICLEKIQPAVAIVVADRRAHAGLLASVIVESGPGNNGDIGECAVLIVVVQDAGGAVAGYENMRPAVVIVIQRGNAKGVMAVGLIDVRLFGDVFK